MTDDELRRAYVRVSHRRWGTFEQAIAHPVYGKIIRAVALHASRHPGEAARINPPIPPVKGPYTGLSKPPALDRKRLASGEKDDD